MAVIRITGGGKFFTPSRSFMLADINRMDRAFPPGVVITANNLPLCVAVVLQSLGRGVLTVLKTWLNSQLLVVDPIIIAAKAYLIWLETAQNVPELLAAAAVNAQAKLLSDFYKDLLRQIQQGVSQKTAGSGTIAENVVSDVIFGCTPMLALLQAIEQVTKLPERYLRTLVTKLRVRLSIISDMKIVVLWLESRKRFLQAWINAIDVSIVTEST